MSETSEDSKQFQQLKDTIDTLTQRVEKLEIELKEKEIKNKSNKFKKGDRVRVLTTTNYGRKGDEAIVIKVGVSRYTLILVTSGQVAVRDFASVERLSLNV